MNDEQIREMVEGFRAAQDNANGSLAKIAESVDGLVARVEQSMDFVKLSRLTDSIELIALRGVADTELGTEERGMIEGRMRQLANRLARRGREKRNDPSVMVRPPPSIDTRQIDLSPCRGGNGPCPSGAIPSGFCLCGPSLRMRCLRCGRVNVGPDHKCN